MADAIDQRVKLRDLKSAQAGKGASMIGVEDSGGSYTGTDLETVLTEVADGTTLDGRYLLESNNLSDLDNAATARTNLGVPNIAGDTFTGDMVFNAMVNLGNGSELTISSGTVTVTRSYHSIDTEGDSASDTLNTISGGTQGDILILTPADSARTVVVGNSFGGAGNILLGGGDFTMDNIADIITLLYNGTAWVEVSRVDNAA